ncbi:hypothetical protein M408DRAFT_333476 [Serendipita vermifera MAFF 305830]|uniref:Oxidation resistance protein 1 n=1 Tax=Serendipita vermifera MAFF 305830 TaxID=933852 RepID=A0A0C3A9R6_SERVB|nr:hypothetical protein M408DRAFT_333476 [Serendipita vermifera MAFF 305830]
MYDPFIDSIQDPQPLQAPLAPSRSATPSAVPPPSHPRADQTSSDDVAALFDPLASLPASNHIPRAPTPSRSTFTTSKLSYDPGAQPKQRPGMLTIATPSNPPPISSPGDPLESLLGTRPNDDGRPKPTRTFSTTPLFQPPPISHKLPPSSFARPVAHSRAISDDFGSFVSVPPALDPLSSGGSSTSIAVSTTSTQKSTIITDTSDFTTGAKQRHAENAERILGEFAKSEEGSGDFLGWLDDAEKEGPVDEVVRDKILKGEEGPSSPPATPVEGPPPTTRTPKHKTPQDMAIKRNNSGSRERSDEGAAGYFPPPSLPRRLTTLLSTSGPALAQMSPSTHKHGIGDGVDDVDDLHGIMAMPGSSSVERLSSIPHMVGLQPHPPMTLGEVAADPQPGISKAATFPPPISSTSSRLPKTIPDSFLTHHTPFASVKYIPPTGAPGFAGEEGWDTGGFAADWDGEGMMGAKGGKTRGEKIKPKSVPRVIKLIGRKEETAGVLTRGLGDVLRPRLPALARLCHTWTLLYSMDQHGISLHTFYNFSSSSASSTSKISGGRKGALLVIRDALDGVFGAYIGEGLRMNMTGERHFGGGDSFLWKTSSYIPDPQAETDEDELPVVNFYKWTGRNDYVALCEPDFVSLGGGDDGKTGLYLASSLLDGSSAKSKTFDNDVLCAEEDVVENSNSMGAPRLEGRTAKFEIIGLEVWGLVAS